MGGGRVVATGMGVTGRVVVVTGRMEVATEVAEGRVEEVSGRVLEGRVEEVSGRVGTTGRVVEGREIGRASCRERV